MRRLDRIGGFLIGAFTALVGVQIFQEIPSIPLVALGFVCLLLGGAAIAEAEDERHAGAKLGVSVEPSDPTVTGSFEELVLRNEEGRAIGSAPLYDSERGPQVPMRSASELAKLAHRAGMEVPE